MSKYIDTEKLLAEIERRLQENADKALVFGAAFAGRTAEDNDLKNLVTSLQQERPSLPFDLDEAAANCTYCEHAYARESFKEGAEWLAWQGASYNTKVGWVDGPTVLDWPDDILDKFEMGDEVIVQIRKKQ